MPRFESGDGKYVVLSGGVGGARFLSGLGSCVAPERVTIIANTGDDKEFFGLHVSPDIDTIIYTLAGAVDPQTGWGLAGDTDAVLQSLARYGHGTWFRLGDRDLATHIHRTWRLRSGATLTEITREIADAWGLRWTILPMTNERVATLIRTPEGEMHFQDYLVRRNAEDPVRGVIYQGVEEAKPAPGVLEAIGDAGVVLIPPSNPIVSVGTILAVPGIREAIRQSRTPVVAISPIIAGKTVKGPADRLLQGLGFEVSAYGVAACYGDLLTGMVIDEQDRSLAERIRGRGIQVLVTDTMMDTLDRRRRLARQVLQWLEDIRGDLR